jgi:TonB family protein
MSVLRVQSDLTSQVRTWFVWNAAEQPVAMQMEAYAIQSLAFLVTRAFKSVPKRGLEIGGLLLGRVVADRANPARCIVMIEDFEAVDSVHEYGPSWRLSDLDRLSLQEALERRRTAPDGARVVGYFRSHTRPDFEFDNQDREISGADEGCDAPVFLLIKPAHDESPTAKIGIRVGRDLTEAAILPLNVPSLHAAGQMVTEGVEASLAEATDVAEATEAPPTATVTATPPARPIPGQRHAARFFWTACTIASATLAIVLAWPTRAPLVVNEISTAAVNASSPEENLPYLSPQNAAPAPVIEELPAKKRGRRAETGIASSGPAGGNVALSELAELRPPLPVLTPQAPPEPRQAPRPTPFPKQQLSHVLPPAHVESEVSIDPAGPSLKQRLAKVNPLKWTGHARSQQHAAQPIHQVRPQISPQLARKAWGVENVDVKVLIEEDGHVTRAEVVHASGGGLLAEPAREAALGWTFQPARSDGRRVASSLILHFRFNISAPADVAEETAGAVHDSRH